MRNLVAALTLSFSAPLAGMAGAQTLPGDPSAGERLARRGCTICHRVGADDRPASVGGAATFRAIANDPSASQTALGVFLQTSHNRMPNIKLTPQEIDDLVSYIMTLKDK